MTQVEFAEIEQKVAGGLSLRRACGSEAKRQAFMRMKRGRTGVAGAASPAVLKALFSDCPLSEEEQESWKNRLWRAGLETALRCGESSTAAQIWKSIMKALDERFGNVGAKGKPFTPEDYKAIMERYWGKENGNHAKDEKPESEP